MEKTNKIINPCAIVAFCEQLPTKDVPKCSDKVTDRENDHNHSYNSKKVSKHDLLHDIIMICQLLPLESILLYDFLEFVLIVGFYNVIELFWLNHIKKTRKSQ